MEKIWLKSYPEAIPHEINPDSFTSLVELFEKSCDKFKSHIAYTNLGQNFNYEQLERYSRAFAAYLQNTLRLQKGDRVALMMPNILQYPIALFGILRAGLIVVNVNPLYTADELTHQLNDSGAKTILVLENFAHTVQKSLPHCQLKHIIVTKMGDMFPTLKGHLINFVLKYIKKMVPKWDIENAIEFKTVLHFGSQQTLHQISISGQDLAFLQYTGGTTGRSKGAMLTHRNMIANLEQATAWLNSVLKDGKEIIITALPLYHIFSLTANCLTFMRFGAQNILITNPRDIPNFVKELKKYPFTAITGVNTLFKALLNHDAFHLVNFSQLKIALGGGMAVQESVANHWELVTKKPLLEAYGLTETSPAVCINPLNLKAYNGSIGLPIPSTEVSIRDDNENELPIGESGELWVRGPQVMRGYWQQVEETSQILTPEGWLKTGDIATIDDKGYVKIVDRKKDMILVSGFNVYPNEVENIIAQLEGVREVAVVGVHCESSGEMVKAFIIKNKLELTEREVIQHCQRHLTAYKIPKLIEFREDLPKTNVGKILRRALK